MHVAVAGVHVQRHEHPARSTGVIACAPFSTGSKARPSKIPRSASSTSRFHDTRIACVWIFTNSSGSPRFARYALQRARVAAISSRARAFRSAKSPASSVRSSLSCTGSSPEKKASSASRSFSLLAIDSSMLMRSMPSVYSPRRPSGITTSSLILNALVCLAIAAVRARSSQKRLRCSAPAAMKPSPSRASAMRTTCEAACHTASSSSPTMSPTRTMRGRPRLFALVA